MARYTPAQVQLFYDWAAERRANESMTMGYVVAAGASTLLGGDKPLKALKDGLFRGLRKAAKPMDEAARRMHRMFGHMLPQNRGR